MKISEKLESITTYISGKFLLQIKFISAWKG